MVFHSGKHCVLTLRALVFRYWRVTEDGGAMVDVLYAVDEDTMVQNSFYKEVGGVAGTPAGP